MRSLLLSLGLFVAACSAPPKPQPDAGNPEVDSGTPDTGIKSVELCDRLATARCNLLSRCFAAFAREDLAGCVQLEQARCFEEFETIRPSFEADLVAVDPAKLSTCEARMKGSNCPPTFPPNYSAIAAHPFSDCALQTGVLTGKVKSGTTCDRAVECEPGSVCIKPGGVCKGTCSKWPQLGEACGFGCAPGLTCNDQGTPMDSGDDRCDAPKLEGAPCSSSVECAPEQICTGTCRPRAKAGEACAFDADRLSTCDPGLACDVTPFVIGATGKCVIPQPANSPCRFHWSCAPGLVCADLDLSGFPTAAPIPGFCRKKAEPDTNCPATPYQAYVGDQCDVGTVCDRDTRKCKAAPKQGDPCTPSSQNCVGVNIYCKPGGSGDVGVCTGPATANERCAFEIDPTRQVSVPCTTGYCDTVSTLSCLPPSKPLGSLCSVGGECLSGRCAVQQDRSLRCAQACN